jgi:hypothetical protein
MLPANDRIHRNVSVTMTPSLVATPIPPAVAMPHASDVKIIPTPTQRCCL